MRAARKPAAAKRCFPLYAWQPDRRASAACIRHFIAEAIAQKQWAAAITDKWKRQASTMSLEMLAERQTLSVHQLARKAMEYNRLRAHMRGAYEGYPGDPPAAALWQRLNRVSL